MGKGWIFVLFFLCIGMFATAGHKQDKKVHYDLSSETVDAVIVSHEKDKETLDLCIEGLLQNCAGIRRVIVVSATKLTDQAEWFDEAQYPFSKNDIELQIGRGNPLVAKMLFKKGRPVGWYFQQLLKLYAQFTIPGLADNVLVIDADTVLLNPVKFLNDSHGGLFCTSSMVPLKRYYLHAQRLLPNYKRVFPEHYSVCHHMLFQKPILEDLFQTVEEYHHKAFWKVFCTCVDIQKGGASEYEIYYNFALRRTDQVELRPLKWTNSPEIEKINTFRKQGYHFVSFHTYLRK